MASQRGRRAHCVVLPARGIAHRRGRRILPIRPFPIPAGTRRPNMLTVIQNDSHAARLERALSERVRGEVRFGTHTRLMYSTDASLYQIVPMGVVIPRDAEDVETVVRLAGEANVPLVPRGGGTSLAGQSIGEAIVIDFAKYM